MPRLAPPLCARCGAPTAWPVRRCRECSGRRIAFRTARAAVEYDARVRVLVSAWKERGLRDIGSLAAELIVESVPMPSGRTITYVPPDGDRSLKRGHHPPVRLAHELGRRWELPVRPVLERTRPLRPQRGLGRDERRHNVRDAFRASGAVGGPVILVDDVYTTGATVSSAASALRKGGAGPVDVVTFARTVRR
jgi:competence protein ComFC